MRCVIGARDGTGGVTGTGAGRIPAAVRAAGIDPVCTARARQLATGFRAVEVPARAHPLWIGPRPLRQVLTGHAGSRARTEKDRARHVILSMPVAMQAGWRGIRDERQRLR